MPECGLSQGFVRKSEWGDLSKMQAVADLERRLVEMLMKLNGLSQAVIDGKLVTSTPTNPVEMTIEFLVTEDGKKWHRTLLEYPGMGDEGQAVLIGMLTGELTTLSRETRTTAKPKREKAKGPKQ